MKDTALADENYDVYHEFPEFVERIAKLKESDLLFSRLCDRYEGLRKEVTRLEQGLWPTRDSYADELKDQCNKHKNRVYHMLTS